VGAAPLIFSAAEAGDAEEIAGLRTAAAERLTRDFGRGHWSVEASERGVLQQLKTSRVLVARTASVLVATLRLATRKPWAIDQSFFADAARPLYLSDMAVAPDHQRSGIGRLCMAEATRIARAWPADAIRLDAYDAPAGAGGFYAKCGYREVGRATYRKTPLIYFELQL
jgi:GNAT superfamily N-acetyltransferase